MSLPLESPMRQQKKHWRLGLWPMNYSKERFDVGLMNSFEFGQAQARIDDAEANVIRSKYEYIFRLKLLEFFFGIPITLD